MIIGVRKEKTNSIVVSSIESEVRFKFKTAGII